MKTLLDDFWPCPAESAADALITLSRCPWLYEWGYTEGRVWWSLASDDPSGDAACKHHHIKSRVQRSISLHQPLDWPS